MAYPDFEKAIVKIQKGQESQLTSGEKISVKHLLLSPTEDSTEKAAQEGPGFRSVKERQEKRRKIATPKKLYMNCDFILCSNAQVERLVSIEGMLSQLIATHILLKCLRRSFSSSLI